METHPSRGRAIAGAATAGQGIIPLTSRVPLIYAPSAGLTTHNLLAGYSPANGLHSKKPHLEDRGKGNRIPCGHQHRQVLYCHEHNTIREV